MRHYPDPVITYSNPLCDGSHYTSTTGITAGKVYVSQVAKFNSESQFIQGTKYHMYTVEMDITDNSATSGLDWDHLNNTGIENAAGDVADANDITFSGSGDISLPVNLSAFSALCTLNGIKLKWTSESEIDNLGYILEKKLGDTVQWQTIASYKTHPELIGQGNSSSYANYTFTDINISTGDVYTYRLSDVNTKGEQTVLGTTKVTVTQDILPKVTGLLPAWPNPFNPVTSIKYQLSSSEQVNLKILDIMGRTVKSLVQDKQQQAGSYTLTWSGKDARDIKVSSGVYFVLLRAGKFTKYQKVLLVR
ncbi:MAG: T9SS type A sorting domain-containing protein [candidate division KSB1 bacterium]|nr:T9SS type A sorting domain-containing protein [candidate division KSB1 bacterium]